MPKIRIPILVWETKVLIGYKNCKLSTKNHRKKEKPKPMVFKKIQKTTASVSPFH
jgi:hypothetical protein